MSPMRPFSIVRPVVVVQSMCFRARRGARFEGELGVQATDGVRVSSEPGRVVV